MDKAWFGLVLVATFLCGMIAGAVGMGLQMLSAPVGDRCVSTLLYQKAIHRDTQGIEGNFAVSYADSYTDFESLIGNRTVYYGQTDIEFIGPALYSFVEQNSVIVWECSE